MTSQLTRYGYWSGLLLLVPMFFILFKNLGAFHIRLWDESWFVVHAYEMYERGSLLVPYFGGEAVNHGTKPPIQTWLQMLSLHFFGYDEFSMRLPSALAAAGTVLLVFHWIGKTAGLTAAWIAALALLTMDGFVNFHSARGAEADALLTLVMTAQAYFFWCWTKSRKHGFIWAFAGMLALSFWVKGVAGFLMLPAFAVYMLAFERDFLVSALRSPHSYAAIISGIALGISYVFIREWAHPGYIDFIMKQQIGRFASDVGHDQPFGYYYERFKNDRLIVYLPAAIVGLAWPFVFWKKASKIHLYVAVIATVFFFFISIARSKLEWYALPVYPLLAIVIGLVVAHLMREQLPWKKMLIIGLIFIYPADRSMAKSKHNTIGEWSRLFEMKEEYLFQAHYLGKNIDGMKVINDHFEGGLLFYKYKFLEVGQDITIQNGIDLEPGDKVLTNSENTINAILSVYKVDTMDQLDNAIVFEINGFKS